MKKESQGEPWVLVRHRQICILPTLASVYVMYAPPGQGKSLRPHFPRTYQFDERDEAKWFMMSGVSALPTTTKHVVPCNALGRQTMKADTRALLAMDETKGSPTFILILTTLILGKEEVNKASVKKSVRCPRDKEHVCRAHVSTRTGDRDLYVQQRQRVRPYRRLYTGERTAPANWNDMKWTREDLVLALLSTPIRTISEPL
jgi:hypothetical protein